MKPFALLLFLFFITIPGLLCLAPRSNASTLIADQYIEAIYQNCLGVIDKTLGPTPKRQKEKAEETDVKDQEKELSPRHIMREGCEEDRQMLYDAARRQQDTQNDISPVSGLDADAVQNEYCNRFATRYLANHPDNPLSQEKIASSCVKHYSKKSPVKGTKAPLPPQRQIMERTEEFYTLCTETANAYAELKTEDVTENKKYRVLRTGYDNCQCYKQFMEKGGDITGMDTRKPLLEQLDPFSISALPDICYMRHHASAQ